MSCVPSENEAIRPSDSHSTRHRRRSASTPPAVWYRSSAFLERSFDTSAEIAAGIPFTRSLGGTGGRATWQWIHSIGSAAVNGSAPVSIW